MKIYNINAYSGIGKLMLLLTLEKVSEGQAEYTL